MKKSTVMKLNNILHGVTCGSLFLGGYILDKKINKSIYEQDVKKSLTQLGASIGVWLLGGSLLGSYLYWKDAIDCNMEIEDDEDKKQRIGFKILRE